MEITPRDIARLLELEKKKAELEFKKNVLGIDAGTDIINITANANELSARIKSAGIGIVVPCEDELKSFDSRIAAFSVDQMKEAMKSRSGDAYKLLKEKGEIVKRNFSNRLEIAKLAIVLAKLKNEPKKDLSSAIRSGKIENIIDLSGSDAILLDQAVRSLKRCGIQCSAVGSSFKVASNADGEGEPMKDQEIRLELANRVVYLPNSEAKLKLDENLKKFAELNKVIQLKNAVRQIKTFSDDEDKEFSDLQRKYLDLLNEQDEILRDFNKEEALTITVG
jgi:hypothetical protein